MILSTLAAVASLAFAPNEPVVNLGRVFTPKEKLSYAIRSHLTAERKPRGLQTFIPMDLDINYDFSIQVLRSRPDGIAVVRYQRPTMTQIDGETFEAPPKKKVEKVNWDMQMTLSPHNEVLDMKDIPKKPAGKKPAPKKKSQRDLYFASPAAQIRLEDFLGQFVSEVYRLSLFVGNLDSALDLAPKTPFEAIPVGHEWKQTVGYQPQKLRGRGGKQAVQRLDYTYTYKGLVQTAKGPMHRVEGRLNFSNDLSEFINQLFEVNADKTGLKSAPLKMDATILFDLDPKTRHTVAANAQSTANFKIIATDNANDPIVEELIKSRTSLRLVSRTVGK